MLCKRMLNRVFVLVRVGRVGESRDPSRDPEDLADDPETV